MTSPVEVKVTNSGGCVLLALLLVVAMNSCSMRLDMMNIKHYLKQLVTASEVPNEEPS